MLSKTSEYEKVCCYICRKDDDEENGKMWGPFWLCNKCNDIMTRNLEEGKPCLPGGSVV